MCKEKGANLRGAGGTATPAAQLEMQNGGLGLLGGGLVEDCETNRLGCPVWPRYLEEGVDVTNRRYVVRRERNQLVLKLDLLRRVPARVAASLLTAYIGFSCTH